MSKKKRIITLLTDFGEQDSYLAEIKGVIYSINPDVEIVETTHNLRLGNIREGAYLLGRYYSCYPEGTTHLAVIDPGVGTQRSPILVKTKRHFFVGPDNGLFSYVLEREKPELLVKLANENYQLPPVSCTFHGRDIFAPAAAYLSLGVDPREFGPELERIESFEIAQPELKGDRIEGEVVHIDHFGNVVTNIPLQLLTDAGRFVNINIKGKTIDHLAESYQERKNCGPFAIVGSGATLEISSFGKDAAKMLGVSTGDRVYVEIEAS